MSITLQKILSCILAVLLTLPLTLSFPGFAYATTCGAGSNITFTDIGGGRCRGFITTTGATTWTVPSDWNSANNKIEAIGGGGGGAGSANDGSKSLGGGGGGEYRVLNNTATLTARGNVTVSVGIGGPGGVAGNPGHAGTDGGNTWVCSSTSGCTAYNDTSFILGAVGGGGGIFGGTTRAAGGTGGVGGSGNNGGAGGATPNSSGSGLAAGGGGAGGPGGIGGAGGNQTTNNADGIWGGGGGGGNGGGGAGQDSPGSVTGGNGGTAQDTTSGGAGSTHSPDVAGQPGSHGSGGGGGEGGGFPHGGSSNATAATAAGGNGGAGIDWDGAACTAASLTHCGSGGGGGAAGSNTQDNVGPVAGTGGLYGGGGGGGAWGSVSSTAGGDGAQGIVVITYTPLSAPSLNSVAVISNNASTTLAKAGDILTVTFTSDITLTSPQVSVLGHATTSAINTSGNTWAASTTVISADTQGVAAFLINAPNAPQTATTTASVITSGANVSIDTAAPAVTILGNNPDSVFASNQSYADPGASATDAHDGSVSVTASGSVNRTIVGTYVLAYTAADAVGNIASASRSVTVTGTGGGGLIVGSGPNAPSAEGLPGYVKPRPQIIYPDGHIVYLDTPAADAQPHVQESKVTHMSASFIREHKRGDTGSDIKQLQIFLNTHGFPLAPNGPGSSGQETNVFGTRTYQALMKFQKILGLPATGYLGPLTKTALNAF